MEGFDGLGDATFAWEKIPVPFVISQQPDIHSCVFGTSFFKKWSKQEKPKVDLSHL